MEERPPVAALRQAGEAIRTCPLPLWRRLHEADLAFRAIEALLDPLSTALCRHTTLFAGRALDAAGWPGWRPVNGAILVADMTRAPAYTAGLAEARHCWLHRDDLWLDLAADQFGLPQVLVGEAGSDAFRCHRVRGGRPPLASLLRTIRDWEGDPRGSWPAIDLADRRRAYAVLLEELGRLR